MAMLGSYQDGLMGVYPGELDTGGDQIHRQKRIEDRLPGKRQRWKTGYRRARRSSV